MQSVLSNLGVVLAAFFATLAAFIFERLTSMIRSRRLSIYDLKREQQLHAQVNQVLVELLVKLDADRVYVAQFHNGDAFLGKMADIKKSRTFERARPGVSFAADRFQNLRLSIMEDEVEMIECETPTITYINKLKDTKYRRMMEMDGVYCTVHMSLKIGSQILGFLGIDFNDCELKEVCNIEGAHTRDLAQQALAPGCILNAQKLEDISHSGRIIQELLSQMKQHK